LNSYGPSMDYNCSLAYGLIILGALLLIAIIVA
jgi:hypothetical protein